MLRDRYKTFGRRFCPERLAAVLAEAPLGEPTIAYRLGMESSNTLRRWKTGVTQPKPETLLRLCQLIGCSIDAIAPKLQSLTPEQEAAIAQTRRIHSDKRRLKYFQKGRL